MKKFFALLLVVLLQFIFIPVPEAHAYSNPVTVDLLTVDNFAALAASAISSPLAGTTLNNGDLGITGAGCTDFPTPCSTPGVAGTVIGGVIHDQDGVATTGQTDATAVVTNLNLRGANQAIVGGGLNSLTLDQGVYDVTSAATDLTGVLTLNGDANSIFIFRFNDTFITGSTASVVFTGGAQACNVYWTSVAGTTFNDTTSMVGSVFAGSSVTFPGGGATLNGRVIAQTAAITFNNTTVNNSSCAAAASSSSSSSAGAPASPFCPTISATVAAPIILSSRRIDADSIFLSWGPYSGVNTFNIQYGPTNGNWLYNVDVTGFSTTLNALPPNQPIWVRIAPRSSCTLGTYGTAMLVGGPGLPNTGFAPHEDNIAWNIALPVGMVMLVSTLLLINICNRESYQGGHYQ